MINYVKEYLDNGHSLEDLKNKYGISSNEFEGMVIFSYSQIDSPKTEPIVRMCRGLVLEKDTWKIVAYPFYRFYNFEEAPEEQSKFNWDRVVATEKIDGSLMQCFVYNDKWYISTRSQIGGMNMISDGIHSFGDLFDLAISPMKRDEFFDCLSWHKPETNDTSMPSMWTKGSVSFIFELVSEFNRIVTPYTETKLYLIGGRCMCDTTKFEMYEEIPFDVLYSTLGEKFINIVKVPNIIPLMDDNGKFRGFEEMKRLSNSVGKMDEGFVVTDFSNTYDGCFPRTKVKNASYVALHHLRGTIENSSIKNYPNILTICFNEEVDEVCESFSQYKDIIYNVMNKYKTFLNNFENAKNDKEFDIYWKMNQSERLIPENKKGFAMIVKKYNQFSTFLFMMYNQNLSSFKECIEEMTKRKAIDTIMKALWENQISKI